MIRVNDICAAGTGLFIVRIIDTLIFIFMCISYDITLAVLGDAGWVDIIAEMKTRVFQLMDCCIDKLPFHRISNTKKYACKNKSHLTVNGNDIWLIMIFSRKVQGNNVGFVTSIPVTFQSSNIYAISCIMLKIMDKIFILEIINCSFYNPQCKL